MRILHTADWHLGKIVNGVYMTEDQAIVLEQLFEVIEQHTPDILIIAGDIYDRSIPPKEAVELLDQTFTRLIKSFNIPILVISGNHDSPDRLQFGSQLFRNHQLYIESKFKQPIEQLTFTDEAGPVHFYLIPYFEPADVQAFFPEQKIHTYQEAMEAVIDTITTTMNPNERHVCITHAFLAGGMESESEDRLSMIGGSPYIDVDIFKDFDYVALGHLHQPQKIKTEHVQYSGSLLKYSFSETNQKKSVTLIDMDSNGLIDYQQIPLLPKRDIRVIEGYYDDLLKQSIYPATEDYLHISLLDDGQLLDPVSQLRKKFPNILRLEKKLKQSSLGLGQLERVKQRKKLSEVELFEAFYYEMTDERLTETRRNIVTNVINQLTKEEREQ
ncbi:exonuclease SbcCD subunit D [Amphibacillus sp. MSJ-3]|uniref:exonuclease SbcCD subunit D n=1 Tax=Amphibacillus sp. MSJ-3 TaxID=2841505 RepID=UPI001C0EB698|nr:exonuclease SbcCD subunit D [Amphibacillus sp. MSJ-3]MBU5595684.1 exonuclease SbcCD subunit D [Amphibacillus sp. MSJ-3]